MEKKHCNKHKDKKVEEQKPNEQPQEVKEDEVDHVKLELKNLQVKYDNLTKINHELELSIAHMQKDFVTKIQEKQIEMKQILDEKKNELEKLNEEKLLDFKTKLFTKDILELINTIEQFDKITAVNSDNEIINNFLAGFKMFSKMFETSLENMKIFKIKIAIGDAFDANKMEIIEAVDSDQYETNQVVEIIDNGYRFENHIIKFAKVKVAK